MKMSLMNLCFALIFILWPLAKEVVVIANQFPFPPLIPSFPPLIPIPPKPMKPIIVRCGSLLFPSCVGIWLTCPVGCPMRCFADCVTCRPICRCNTPGAVCMDPRFVGGDGISFYFHGRKDHDFCLVSDANLHINGHFIGKRRPSLTRDFTWVQSLGIIFDNHKLLVGAKKTSIWDDNDDHLEIFLDGTPISLPNKENTIWHSSKTTSTLSITRTRSTNGMVVEVSNNFKVTVAVVPITKEESKVHGYDITDEDCFAHLEIGFKFYNLSDKVDGVLGQTYRSNYVSKTKVNVPMAVMGGDNKYSTSGIFATDCLVSRFGRNDGDAIVKSDADQYSSIHCSSGMNGNGLVCKR